jgi:hypothetical protein
MAKPNIANMKLLWLNVAKVQPGPGDEIMRRLLPAIQIVLGTTGVVLCSWLFVRTREPAEKFLQNATEFASATEAEFSLAITLSREAQMLAEQFESLGNQNLESVRNGDLVLEHWVNSLRQWQMQISSLSTTAALAAQSCERFARVLPLQVPTLSYELDKLQIDIPKIKVQEQTIEIPYPNAQVGSKKETIDLGVTKVDIRMPTIEIAANSKKVTLPSKLEVMTEERYLEYPKDFQIQQTPLLAEEKQVLQRMQADLQNAAINLTTSARSLAELEKLSDVDLRRSLQLTSRAISQSLEQLSNISRQHLPEFEHQLLLQRDHLKSSTSQIRDLLQFLPWLWGVLGLISVGSIVNGFAGWNVSNSHSRF